MSCEKPVRGIENTSIPGIVKLIAGEYVPDGVKKAYSRLKNRVLIPSPDKRNSDKDWKAADVPLHGLRKPIVLFHLGSAIVREKITKKI